MNNKTKAITLMVLSAMSFAMMQVVIALTVDGIPLFEQLFFRNLVATFLAVFTIKKQKYAYFGQRKNRALLLLRASFGYLGMITTFYASGHGNQGDVSTIMKMSPFVVTILAVIFLKETVTKYQIIGLGVATVGVFFVSNPQFNSNMLPIISAFFACLFSGIAYTFVGALKGKEPPAVIIFVFSSFSTLVTMPIMLMNFVMPTLFEGVMLIFIGIFAGLGQIALTNSYLLAKASEVSIYNYSGIIFSMFFGFIFLQQTVKATSLIGAALVIIAGAIVFFGNRKLEKKLAT